MTVNGLFSSLKAAVVRALEEPAFLQQQLTRARLTEQEFSRKLSQPFRQETKLQRLDSGVADLKRMMEAESNPTESQPDPANGLVLAYRRVKIRLST